MCPLRLYSLVIASTEGYTWGSKAAVRVCPQTLLKHPSQVKQQVPDQPSPRKVCEPDLCMHPTSAHRMHRPRQPIRSRAAAPAANHVSALLWRQDVSDMRGEISGDWCWRSACVGWMGGNVPGVLRKAEERKRTG